ncbi:MAG: Crp/Fnr family transcriptional regulator [Pseudomonadota bacterium]|nr:Crp/Fnr family transcriptional regulator [Pseudomonadota bacterium]
MSGPFSRLFEDAARDVRAPGEPLFRTGDKVVALYRVTQGAVRLVRVTPEGMALTLQSAKAGDVLAEASLYSTAYHCDAVAGPEGAEVTRIGADVARDRLRANPDLSEHWAARLASAAQSARMRAEIRTIRTVAGRLDAWLSIGNELPPKGQYQDLASEIGTTREALYRELARRR